MTNEEDVVDLLALEATAKAKLTSYIERIERLESDKKAIQGDIRDVYAEAKSDGFDTVAIRKIIKLREKDEAEREEEESILETYMHALGMLKDYN
jgi:uncharacterized protein (UPF0335 family)